ncbi:MAG: phosphopantothenate--cysteine ligase [Clostridiales Family XIII bacterium]|jgi:phosphopantothenate-cysteine ligase|nr:phosphopantothenate--cysteine ligase [Clostridiales Family XIII bacterium]
MNILITAGGTTERIDAVRGITNAGTGALGALIAERFAASNRVARIFHVHGNRAAEPAHDKITLRRADDTRALERTVTEICSDNRVDAVIHSMAVSDYRVRSVSASRAMGEFVANRIAEHGGAPDAARIARAIAETPSLATGGKIDSGLDDMIVVMERTPKIIAMFRKFSPNAFIVGFKLLVNVSEKTLIDTAYELLKKNDCDCVLANDLRDIGNGKHIGRLLRASGAYTTYDNKEAIAEGIVRATLEHAREIL